MTQRGDWHIAQLLSQAEHQMSRCLSAALKDAGLTLDQWRVLTLLADGAGHTMSEIADEALLPPATLTRQVDRLVEAALIYRRDDPEDRRRVRVFLSSRGRSLHRDLAARIGREEASLTANLGEEERAMLAELLQRLTAAR